ncbi:MAG TPA: Uma2 family endonuclease [Stenomitos sp.]
MKDENLLCPDFVVELLSPSDSLKDTQEKMNEYGDNGACLGWLMNRKSRQVAIYRQGQDLETKSDSFLRATVTQDAL